VKGPVAKSKLITVAEAAIGLIGNSLAPFLSDGTTYLVPPGVVSKKIPESSLCASPASSAVTLSVE